MALPDAVSLQRDLDALVETGVPAASAYVVDDAGGELFLQAGPAGGDLSPEHCWRVASVTKPFVGAVVLQLVEEGRLRLGDSIARHLAQVGSPEPSVEQLLCHRSGLRDYVDELPPRWLWNPEAEARRLSPAQQWEIVAHLPRRFAPGERYEYSNTNYLLLGQLVEHVTGRPVAQEIDERICKPLGLTRTFLAQGTERLPPPVAPGWEADVDDLPRVPRPGDAIDMRALPIRDVTHHDISWAWAAGGMVSTAADLSRFLPALLEGPLLGDETRARMLCSRTTNGPDLRYRTSYGLGVCRFDFPNGASGLGHTGGLSGYYTYALRDPLIGRTAILYMGTMMTSELNGAEEALERAIATALAPSAA